MRTPYRNTFGKGVAAGVCLFSFVNMGFAQNASPQLDEDWAVRGIESVKDVHSYCVYLDRFIPYAFQSERRFLHSLSSLQGQANLERSRIISGWSDLRKNSVETWGALECAQMLYGTVLPGRSNARSTK